jgi:excisionase family DNA binding protein
MSGPERKQTYTPKEIAAEEQCHPETIYRALWSGELDGYRIGNRWRITAEALDNYRRRVA